MSCIVIEYDFFNVLNFAEKIEPSICLGQQPFVLILPYLNSDEQPKRNIQERDKFLFCDTLENALFFSQH